MFAATIMDIVYGINITATDDEYILREERAGPTFGQSKVPGAFWVDSFPLLRYVPAWMPGASARKFGAQCKPLVMELRDQPFRAVVQNMV